MVLFPRLQSSKKITKLCFLDYNVKKENYMALFPRLQSKKEKITHYPTNQNLDSGARLQNGKVLGTHSA